MSKSRFGLDASHELRALLEDWLRTHHLAQPLESIELGDDPPPESPRHALSVVGVTDHGKLIGSVRVAALPAEDWRKQVQPLTDQQVISGDAPLLVLLARLIERRWLFVRQDDQIDGFVSRSDLHHAPFRMLLFGLISLFEMRLLYLVRQRYTTTTMASVLSVNRLDKAKRLHQDRRRRGEELDLADCLQIADKRDLLLALPDCLPLLGFRSQKKACHFFGRVESLRDRLVHANDLIGGSNWEEVLATTIELADFLSRNELPPTPPT